MDRQAFEYLYLHANSIAELAFLRTAASLFDAAPADVPTAGAVAASEAEMLARMQAAGADGGYDWSALEGLPQMDFSAATDAELAEAAMLDGDEPPDSAGIDRPPFGVAIGYGEPDPESGPPDVDRYLARAYAARAQLAPRVDDCFERADMAALGAALLALPAGLAPLTGPLTAAQLTAWLDRHDAFDDGLMAAVNEIRRLEPLF